MVPTLLLLLLPLLTFHYHLLQRVAQLPLSGMEGVLHYNLLVLPILPYNSLYPSLVMLEVSFHSFLIVVQL